MRRCFDIETDGLLDTMTHIKCLNMIDIETGLRRRFTDFEFYQDAVTGETTAVRTKRNGTIDDGLALLGVAEELSGQNIVGFDLEALRKIRGFRYTGKIVDTKTLSMMLFPDLMLRDKASRLKGGLASMPGNLVGAHKLEAWGYRLGVELKGEFKPSNYGDWTWSKYPFSVECDDYCAQDVVVNVGLVEHLLKRAAEACLPQVAIDLENEVARIIALQTDHGWAFDEKAAEALAVDLMKEKIDHERGLVATFGEFYLRDGVKDMVPKKTRRSKAESIDGAVRVYTEGASFTKVKLVQFNPGSHAHIALLLGRRYGWEPVDFTPKGQPKVDEEVLGQLPYPEVKALVAYFKTTKMLGQVADGKTSFLKCVRNGRIHGSVNPCGAVTGRMTHSKPNVAQSDKDPRVRGLFVASPGYVLVGTDADALELRCLAHFLAAFDKGAYTKTVLEGKKEDGTDMHSRNMRAMNLTERECAKREFYAWLYGAGDFKLGLVAYNEDWDEAKRARFNAKFQGEARNSALVRIGRRLRDGLIQGIEGADTLVKLCKNRAKTLGYVRGLDGRRVQCRSQHAALNTLLQSAGAIVMKKALAVAQADFDDVGLTHGVDYAWVGNIHDELQVESKEEHAEFIGTVCAESIRVAGEFYKFRCPLAGNFAVGATWADTH